MIINKSGPMGNAFSVLGHTAKVLKQMGLTKDEIDVILEGMQSDDYEHLCEVAEESTNGIIQFEE